MAGKFTKNTLITVITRVLQLILGIGTSVIIARVLGPEGKGVYSLALLLPTLLITFTNLGIGPASVFYLGKKKYSSKEVLGANIIFSGLISIFALMVGLIIVFFFPEKLFPGVPQEYLLLALSLIPLQVLLTFVVDVLLGLQKIKKYNFIQLIPTFIYLILIAVFLLGFHFGVKAAIIAEVLSLFVGCIILFINTKKETGGIVFSFTKEIRKDFFSYGIKAYFGNIFSFIHYRIDQFMLNIFLNPTAVGVYSIAVGISEKIWLVSQSASTVLFPRVSSETDAKRLKEFTPMVCRNILWITVLLSLFLCLIAPWLIVLLYSDQYLESILPFRILLIGAVALAGSKILANDFAGRGKPMINTYISIASVVLNIILNILWIPKFGIIGAAWATAISYSVIFLINIFVYAKISDNKIKDILFIKKSDFKYYKNFLLLFKNKYLNLKK
ncbi:MAG: flippase [Candidatus Pacebacteria bacterium]|nr:flippase [Candidatus Paceibacterota bacterium]